MLKRLYVDNFRCLTNFEIKFDRLNVLMGENGSGKSTVFEVLRRLRSFLLGDANVAASFPVDSVTRWGQPGGQVQRLQLDIAIGSHDYNYTLDVSHFRPTGSDGRKDPHRSIEKETLTVDGKQVFDLDGSASWWYPSGGRPMNYVHDMDYSGASDSVSVAPEYGGERLEAFRGAISKWIVPKLSPGSMLSDSKQEESQLSETGDNFPSWYWYVSKEYEKNVPKLIEGLKEALPGFNSLCLREAGERQILKAGLITGGTSHEYNFGELSDGQRALIVLYTLVLGLRGQGYSLFLDEPGISLQLQSDTERPRRRDRCGQASGGSARAAA